MNLKGRIPVEPLAEDRLVHIERRIVANAADRLAVPARTPRRMFASLGLAFAVAAALLVGWKLHGVEPVVTAPQVAETPHTFAIAASGEHSIVDVGGAKIASDPGSDLEVSQTSHRVVLKMTRGKIAMDVTHRADRTVVIVAGDTEIEDVGTKFTVAYDGSSHVDVRVTEGEVKVTREQRSVEVAAGFAWTTDRGLVAIAELEQAATVVASAVPAPTPPLPPPAPTVVAVATKRPAVHVEHHTYPAAPVIAPHPRAHTPTPTDPYVELRVAIRNQPIALDPKLDGQRDAAAEVTRLKPIAYSPQKYGAEASAALYKMAVLLHKPLHQDSEAMRTLDMYVRRFHAGNELAAALWLRVRISCAGGIGDECRQAAYSYQHQVPTGPASDVAIRIINAQ
jgi:hypothetical protein